MHPRLALLSGVCVVGSGLNGLLLLTHALLGTSFGESLFLALFSGCALSAAFWSFWLRRISE